MLPMANPGKGSSSKFEAWFLLNAYCFHPNVKLKSHTSNHCKSGISRIVFPEGGCQLRRQQYFSALQQKACGKQSGSHG
jgi:hypothetical protein